MYSDRRGIIACACADEVRRVIGILLQVQVHEVGAKAATERTMPLLPVAKTAEMPNISALVAMEYLGISPDSLAS